MTTNSCRVQSPAEIIQGADAVFTVRLTNRETGYPIDLTDIDDFSADFLNADDSVLTVSETPGTNGSKIEKMTPALWGTLIFTLKADDTDALAAIESKQLIITLTDGSGGVQKAKIDRAYTVFPKSCTP